MLIQQWCLIYYIYNLTLTTRKTLFCVFGFPQNVSPPTALSEIFLEDRKQ